MLEIVASLPFLAIGVGGSAAILGGALALGIRHGIDWDHIAAITDITSATSGEAVAEGRATNARPVLLSQAASRMQLEGAGAVFAGANTLDVPGTGFVARLGDYARRHRAPLFLGTMYALGHGSMVVILGLMAILFSEFLPTWVDPIMERIVGVTLLVLAGYLFYSIFRYFRGGEFRIRSRWMLVFAGIGRMWRWTTNRLLGRVHEEVHSHAGEQQYGAGTAYGIGLIHGIGAETGTQVLIIGAAVGAGSQGMSVATLLVFVFGLLISNSAVTILSTSGFISVQRRQIIYVVVGLVAAVFSLVVGLLFLSLSTGVLPDLDPYFRWIGGPT